jgi:uncharacterized repeat protein (TIGR01451 family)
MRKGFRRALLALGVTTVGLSAVVAFAGATTSLPTTGAGIVPTFVPGSNIFADCVAAPTGQEHIFGLKVENGSVGSYNGTWSKSNADHTHGDDNPLQVTISNAKVVNGVSSFDWSANMPVDYVYVKGGNVDGSPGAVSYDYSSYGWGGHPATGPWGDTGLVYPKDSISHVLFCTVKKLRVEKTATASFTREYTWSIAKKVKTTGVDFAGSASLSLLNGDAGAAHWQIAVDQTGSTDKGFEVDGTITVLNSSPYDVAAVADESLSNVTFGGACTAKSGTDDKANLSVGKGATATCSYSAPLAAKTNGTNTVEVDPTTPDWMASASASAPYAFGNPTSEKNKTVRWSDSNGHAKTGIVANDTTSYDTSHSCPESRTVTNTATLYGDADANLGSSVATVTITCTAPQALTVTKTATPSFTRTWTWHVHKSADQTSFALADGATASTNWNVAVTKDAPVDSAWSLSGSITVHNPNGFAVDGVVVTDGLGGSVTCPATTVAANGNLVCTYVVSRPNGASGTNTATATTTTAGVPQGTGGASFAFTAPTTKVNENVDVADTNGKTWSDVTGAFTNSYSSGTLPCANATYTNTVRVIGDEGKQLDESAATITTTCSTTPPVNPPVNPPVTPETPKIDIGVTKSATSPVTSGQTVTYTIVVSNVAQVAAGAVELSDPAPTGISYQSATSSDGTVACSVAASLVTCSRPGAFAVGASFVVTIKATAAGAAGTTITNEVLVNTTGDINPANNRAQAATQILAPLKPPVAKPNKPVVKPAVCSTIVVTPKTISAGKKSKVSFLVTRAGKPVKGVSVKLVGPGIHRTVKSAKGKTVVLVKSSKSGIVTVSIAGKKGCNTARVGVVGSFEPPVTG